MANFDMLPYVNSAVSIAPVAATTDLTGASVDLAGYGAAVIQLVAGVVSGGSMTPLVEESEDNSTFTAVDDKYLVGPAQEITGQEAAAIIDTTNQTKLLGYVGKKRYIRVKLVEATANMIIGVNVLRMKPNSVA